MNRKAFSHLEVVLVNLNVKRLEIEQRYITAAQLKKLRGRCKAEASAFGGISVILPVPGFRFGQIETRESGEVPPSCTFCKVCVAIVTRGVSKRLSWDYHAFLSAAVLSESRNWGGENRVLYFRVLLVL